MISIGRPILLQKFLIKDQKARRGKKEIVRKKLQLGEPIQRLPVIELTLPPLEALHGLYYLSHKLGDGPRLIVLPYVKLEVTGRPSLFSRGLSRSVPYMFTLVPVRNVSPTRLPTDEEEVVFSVLHLQFLLNGRHEA